MGGAVFIGSGFDKPIGVLGAFANPDRSDLMIRLGELVVSQTQRRIRSEKTAPDGSSWKANLLGTSILFRSGALAGSVHSNAQASRFEVGSDLIYARIHNQGGAIKPKNKKALSFPLRGRQDRHTVGAVNMPKRQFLGLSPANEGELNEALLAWAMEKAQ